jgi:hypothetical protein
MATIEELLKSMLTLQSEKKSSSDFMGLPNSRETWERIGNGDAFEELGFQNGSDKDAWLKDWIESNPYTAIN